MPALSLRCLAFALTAFLLPAAGHAQSAAPADPEAELRAAFAEGRKAATDGPAAVPLTTQGTIKLPEGFVYVPAPQSERILKAMGNRADPSRLGVIFPTNGDDWFLVVRYTAAGYVSDDEASHWKSDEMLEQIKEGTEAGNAERVARGIPGMEIVGWVQPPTYDKASQRLVWALESRDKDAAATAPHGINYNTYLLGREGYLSMNLVTSMDQVAQHRVPAESILKATEFAAGKRYADFDKSTDKVAEYGIAALVGGVAAKKLGLFALLLAFGAKFAKLLAAGGVAVAWGATKLFRRRPAEPAPAAPAVQTAAAEPPREA